MSSEERSKCANCGGRSEEGYFLDHSHGTNYASMWIEGPPERSFWMGVKLKGRAARQCVAWRCVQCGRLELYAD